jgi:tRNA dimethylallyltransferase
MSLRHLALVGPTASGKSALAVAVAEALGDVEIVSMDSMAVYRGMDIGTATPSPADRGRVPHHLLDIADPSEEWSVARHQEAARQVIAEIEARHHRALLVGGTGLYVQAVVDDLDLPGEHPEARAEIEAEPNTEALHRRLVGLDPVAAARMEPTNRRRVVRALEVTIGSGRPFSSFGPGLDTFPATPFDLMGIWVARADLDVGIEHRFRRLMDDGLLDEVSTLARRTPPMSRTARQALGYRELLDHLAERLTLDDAVTEAVRRTRRFARRQQAWFGRDPRIGWVGHDGNPRTALPLLLRHWGTPVPAGP